jgi:hypothetical protein
MDDGACTMHLFRLDIFSHHHDTPVIASPCPLITDYSSLITYHLSLITYHFVGLGVAPAARRCPLAAGR